MKIEARAPVAAAAGESSAGASALIRFGLQPFFSVSLLMLHSSCLDSVVLLH